MHMLYHLGKKKNLCQAGPGPPVVTWRPNLSHFLRDVKAPVLLFADHHCWRVFPSFQIQCNCGEREFDRCGSNVPIFQIQTSQAPFLRSSHALTVRQAASVLLLSFSLSLGPVPFSSLPAIFSDAGILSRRLLYFLFLDQGLMAFMADI